MKNKHFEEVSEVLVFESFDNYLDDIYRPFQDGGFNIAASQVIKSCKPDDYQMMLHDWCLKAGFMIVQNKDQAKYFELVSNQ